MEAPGWLDDLDRPLVLVTTSSEFQDDGVLVRTALEALPTSRSSVVVTMPAGVPDDLVVPANARVEQFVPHGPLLERAAVAITHGGMGGTQKALRTAYPCAWCPSGATSSRWRVASRSVAAAPGCRRRS